MILLIANLPFVANGQDNDKPDLPAEAELSAIVDSILDEGLRLYSFERISWQASDSAMAHCTALAQVNGSGVVVDSVSFTHFFTRDDEVVFSYKSDLSNENVSWDNTVRPITDAERNARDERKRCIRLAIESYGDSLRASGNVNVDVILLAFSSACMWTVYSLILRKLNGKYSTLFITRKVFFYGALSSILVMLTETEKSVPWQNFAEPVVAFNFLCLTVFSSLFGYLVWNKVLEKIGTVLASNYIYGIPLVTIITAVIALGENITAVALLGAAAIVAGMVLAEWKK